MTCGYDDMYDDGSCDCMIMIMTTIVVVVVGRAWAVSSVSHPLQFFRHGPCISDCKFAVRS